MPPLTLPSVGWERSTISLHLFGWWRLGMTPNLLTCACGTKNSWNGPATRPRATLRLGSSPLFQDVEEHNLSFAWKTSMGVIVA